MENKFTARLIQLLKEKNLSAILVCPAPEMHFFLGHSPILCERFQGLFIKNDGSMFYICNALTKNEVERIFPNKPLYTWMDGEDFTEVCKKAFADFGLLGTTIGVNGSAQAFNVLTMAEKIDVKFTNAKDLLEEMRIIKNSDELQALRDSAKITDEVLTELLKHIKAGMTENDVRKIIQRLYTEKGIAGASGGLVAASANGSLPHHMGSETVLKEGDSVILDFGCTYNGYVSDMTRTVFIGKASDKQRKVYDAVLKANLAGEQAAVLGAFIPDVEKSARDVIDEAGFGEYFTHRLGHGIGCMGHEAPYILANNERNLEKGMAFSVEPGIYIPNEFGVRIEDIVIINEKGEREVLNTTSKELTII